MAARTEVCATCLAMPLYIMGKAAIGELFPTTKDATIVCPDVTKGEVAFCSQVRCAGWVVGGELGKRRVGHVCLVRGQSRCGRHKASRPLLQPLSSPPIR